VKEYREVLLRITVLRVVESHIVLRLIRRYIVLRVVESHAAF
jgi:hypothetical protein